MPLGMTPWAALESWSKDKESEETQEFCPFLCQTGFKLGSNGRVTPRARYPGVTCTIKSHLPAGMTPWEAIKSKKIVRVINGVPPPTQKPPISRERVVVQRRACARWIPEKKLEEWIHPLKRPQGHPKGGNREKPILPKVKTSYLAEFALP